MVSHIYREIYIAGSSVLAHQNAVHELGIKAVLRLDGVDRQRGQWSSDFILLDMPFSDASAVPTAIFERGTTFIYEQVEAQHPLLVHCQMGISRSSTLVMAYLIAHEKMTLARAYATVQRGRPIAAPHVNLLKSLVQHYHLPYDMDDIEHPAFLRRLLLEDQTH